jgi:uncharacterized metal-binding protein YceD (DUF177 family)
MSESEFSRTIDVSRLPADGLQEHFSANAAELEALAGRFGVEQLHSLELDVDAQPWKKGSCRVRGRARASMTRTCVVTLDLFETSFEVRLDRLFASAPAIRVEGKEITVSVDDEDIGQIINGEIEVGEFAVEELLLELDPHPRKPGAAFTPEAANDVLDTEEDQRESPFAVLKSLKKED